MTSVLTNLVSMITTYPKTASVVNLVLGGVLGHLIAQFLL